MKFIISKNKGFSLIELIVAIAIFAILSSIAVPSFIGWRDKAKIRDAVSTLRGDLELSKSRAIQENELVTLLFNTDGYTIFMDDGSGGGVTGNWVRDGSELLLLNRELPAGVVIDLAGPDFFDSDRTRFNGRGRITNLGVVTIVSHAGEQRQLDINNRFGRISIN